MRLAYENGSLSEQWDDETRTYTDFRTDPSTVRAYNADENALADATANTVAEESNRVSIEEALAAALETLQLIIDDTNSNINSNPASRIKDLARVQRRLIRLVLRRFDGAL
jgi:hypothetical protein